tara:strand:+ start:755 stop:1402 length:648 start_codon:yes stop_codon:yes gene_type:complete
MECSKQVIVALLVVALVYMFLTCNNINVLERFSPVSSTTLSSTPSSTHSSKLQKSPSPKVHKSPYNAHPNTPRNVQNKAFVPNTAATINKTAPNNLSVKPYTGDSGNLTLSNPNDSKIELGVCGGETGAFLSSNLLPVGSTIENDNFSEFSPANLKGKNFIDSAKFLLGTQSQTLRNASHDIRSEPPNPQKDVCAWNNTTISPDMHRRLLEIGTG